MTLMTMNDTMTSTANFHLCRMNLEHLTHLACLAVQETAAFIRAETGKVQSGDNVWVNFALMRLPDLSTLEVRARLSDVDDGRVEPGMRVMMYLDAYPEVGFPGVVQVVNPLAREMSRESLRRSFAVRVAFDRTDAARMLPGMSVRVEVLGDPPRVTTTEGG